MTFAAGMMGDDIAKSPHMANIGGSVYHDVPREGYWVDREDNPSPLMRQSLLYKLHTYKIHKNSNPVIEKCVVIRHRRGVVCWLDKRYVFWPCDL